MFLIAFSNGKPLFTDRVWPLHMFHIMGSLAPLIVIMKFLLLPLIRFRTGTTYQLMSYMSMMKSERMNFLSMSWVITEILIPTNRRANFDMTFQNFMVIMMPLNFWIGSVLLNKCFTLLVSHLLTASDLH